MGSTLYDRLRRSVYLLHVDSGSCNGCDIEVLDVLTPYFDVERFGVKLVASPKQADVVLVTGPVTRQFRRFLKRVYEYLPKPTAVIACGSCACGGGIWHDTYNVVGGVDKVIPVDAYIPGCPPRPSAIIHGVLVALGVLNQRVRRVEERVKAEGFRVSRPAGSGVIGDFRAYRWVALELKRLVGYRLAYRLLKDYAELLRRSESVEDVRRGVDEIVKAWEGDERIKEALERVTEGLSGKPWGR